MSVPAWELASVEMLVQVYINCHMSLENSNDISKIKVFGYVNMIKGILYLHDELPEGVDEEEFKKAALNAVKNPPQPILPVVPEELYSRFHEVQSIQVPERAFKSDPPERPKEEEEDARED